MYRILATLAGVGLGALGAIRLGAGGLVVVGASVAAGLVGYCVGRMLQGDLTRRRYGLEGLYKRQNLLDQAARAHLPPPAKEKVRMHGSSVRGGSDDSQVSR